MADSLPPSPQPRFRRSFTAQKKLLVGAALVAVALGYLVFTAFRGASAYYLTVSELKAQEGDMAGQAVRLNGAVVPGSIVKGASGLDVRFAIADHEQPTDRYTVTFHGVLPDLFQDGVDVVAEGQLGPDGTFRATNLLTRCASKYEPEVRPGAAPSSSSSAPRP